jgi:hypothetical protein
MDRGDIPHDQWWEQLGDKLDKDFDAAIDAARALLDGGSHAAE